MKLTNLLVMIFSIFTISRSIGAFLFFQPFKYLDNEKSQIICNKNSQAFDIGPNYIYTFDDKLDSFNDIKARKLCEFGIIRDYGNMYKASNKVNYSFKPLYAVESSWSVALFLSIVVLTVGTIVVRPLQKLITHHLLVILLSGVIFAIFLYKPTQAAFCLKKTAKKVMNFRNAAFKNGVYVLPEEDRHVNAAAHNEYMNCLNKHE